jgi:polyhydroxyalkanoate synthesis regulator phasin
MFEVLQKAVFASIGLGMMTKEKVEQIGKKLLEEAKVSEAQGKKFLKELTKKSEDARLALEQTVSSAVNATLKKLEIPSRAEVEALKKRIAELEEALNRKG